MILLYHKLNQSQPPLIKFFIFFDWFFKLWYNVCHNFHLLRRKINLINRLKQLRKTLNMNQREFSNKLGISQTSYSMIESGVNSLSNKHIKLICATFSVSENWIRTGEGNMFLSSPYDRELMTIFGNLTTQSKSYLLSVANGLLELQKSFISSKYE